MISQQQLDQLWDFNDAFASERRFALAAVSAHSESERAEFLTQRARALGLQEKYAEGNRVLDEIDLASFDQRAPEVAVRVALERGRILNSSGFPAEALPSFELASNRASTSGLTFLEVDALHMLAIADGAQARRWTAAALDRLAATSDTRTLRWTVSLHNNLGWTLHDGGNFSEALEEFTLALQAAREFGNADQQFLGRWAHARCLRSLGRNSEALTTQRELAKERPDDPFVAEELALLQQGQ